MAIAQRVEGQIVQYAEVDIKHIVFIHLILSFHFVITIRDKERRGGSEGSDTFLLDLVLPEGYIFSEYSDFYGWAGGYLIYPEIYMSDGNTPDDWRCSGFIGKIYQSSTNFHYIDGLPDGEYFPMHNHSYGEIHQIYEYGDWAIVEAEVTHDVYQDDEVKQASFWYFFYAKENREVLYYLSLSKDVFSEEQALTIAKTLKLPSN